MPRLLINYNYPVQKLERISIYDDPTTEKTSNGTRLSKTDFIGESLVTDISILQFHIYACHQCLKEVGPFHLDLKQRLRAVHVHR